MIEPRLRWQAEVAALTNEKRKRIIDLMLAGKTVGEAARLVDVGLCVVAEVVVTEGPGILAKIESGDSIQDQQ